MKQALVMAAVLFVCVLAPVQVNLAFFPRVVRESSVTYSGFLDIQLSGILRENLTALELANGTLVHINFYCTNGPSGQTLVSTTDRGGGSNLKNFIYCDPSQLPFKDGTQISVRGTLIQPSQWPTMFSGDFYVMEIEP